jgi:hypothetical protein
MRKPLATLFLLLAASFMRADEPVRILIIDGSGATGIKKGGDAYYVETVLKSVKGYLPTIKDAVELEKADLKEYPVLFLLNVPDLSDAARTNLEGHVKAGGGVAFFLGDKVRPVRYNRLLYRKGEGLFPVQLANQPTDPPDEKQKAKDKGDRPTLYLRAPQHSVCADLPEARAFFQFLDIDRYYPLARSKRDQAAGRVQEIISLPNDGELDSFKEETQKLNRAIPSAEESYKEFRPGLQRHQWAIRQALIFGKKAWELGDALNGLLEDRGNPDDAEKPDLTAFWQKSELKELRQKVAALRDKTRYGEPLVVAAPFGKGRVVVCLTSAGESWNDWAAGPASPTFVILVANIAKHLTGADVPAKEEKRR